jgi:tetratricopeptide (TPR) repeat protein
MSRPKSPLFVVAVVLGALPSLFAAGPVASSVKVWEKKTVIPTYLAGEPELNPMFYFGRQSQGAEGRVYPYPLYDTLTHRKADKTYNLVYLENEYVRIGVLPEIGGRIFEGVDKTNNYDFFYRQHVIKPALIGLIGAWISGGVEWNIPHHHRASTFLPVQYKVEEDADGSKTVWVGELEVRHRMRWAVGYTLRPGRAYLEARLRILNRTPVTNSMLCFANVAVHVNENYQVIFPPSTQYGTHHSKREFTKWPIADGRYGGADFSRGVDVSWFKNHENANSIFAWNYEDDFLAGYDHGKEAGLLSVADHHVVPGKKLWTWGNGARGRMWDHILTDADGPYIELMVGAYSDNQPDYSWLQPYETKSFSINWYPFRGIGGVKNANLDAAVNLDVRDGKASLGFYATSAHASAVARLKLGERTLLEERIAINPGKPYARQVALPAGADPHALRASLSAGGKELIAYTPVRLPAMQAPKAVQPPPAPKDIATNEELYLTGLRVDQFHDPNLDPEPFWEEALRRDPGDVRVNVALGITLFKKARFADAERHFRKALERATDKYTAPRDGEPFYYLGLALQAQGRDEEAFAAFYKATWSAAWKAPGYFALAEIASARGGTGAALDFTERSLESNALNLRALNLKAALLRRLGRAREALATLEIARRKCDPLDARSMAERWLASKTPESARAHAHPANAAEVAAEYLNAGLWRDGTDVLLHAVAAAPVKTRVRPMVYYYLACFAGKLGDPQKAAEYARQGRAAGFEYEFPFQWEAERVLRAAMALDPSDARAPYYLGNLLFDWRPADAVRLWEQSAALDPSFAIVHRNLGVAYSHDKAAGSLERAIASFEKAVSLDRRFPVHFAELDQVYETAKADPAMRLALLERNHTLVSQRDDSLNREIGLKVALGKYDDAIRLMTGRRFAVWEGGNLNVAESWVDAHLFRARQRLAAGRAAEALADVQAAATVPDNLPSERIGSGVRNREIAYWMGMAQEGAGNREEAKTQWEKAAAAPAFDGRARRRREGSGLSPMAAQTYYQAMALGKLGRKDEAEKLLRGMVDAARGRSEATAHYVAALGWMGLGETGKAKQELQAAVKVSPDHAAARFSLAALK